MNRIFSGAVASALLMGILMSSAGCKSKPKREHEVIKETDTWYSCNEIDVAGGCNALNYEHFTFMTPVVIDDYVVATYNAYNDLYSDPPHDPVCIFDSAGNLLKELEITNEIELSSKVGIVEEKGKMVFYYSSNGKLWKAEINMTSFELENHREIDLGGESIQFTNCLASEDYVFVAGIKKGINYFFVIKDDAMIFSKEMNVDYPVLHGVAPKDGGFQLLNYSSLYYFDPAKSELKYDSMIYDSNIMRNEVIGFDGRTYVKEADGIYVDGEPYVKYCDTDCNVYRFMLANLLEVTEDSIVLNIGITTYGNETPMVMCLHKTASNPNAGKTVISAKSYGNCIDTMTGEAIRRFNKENKDYFVKYASISLGFISDEVFLENYEKDFKEEIVSSEAADIYFGVDSLWWFQNDDYFIDIGKEIELDQSTYYTGIINSAARDGKLFYMPLSYTAEGLWTDASNVKSGARGFTYDEYIEFVSTVGNGTDSISEYYSQEEYFNLCFSMMNDTWFKNGEVNVANAEFELMCEYIVNNVPEKPLITEEQFFEGSFKTNSSFVFRDVDPYDCFHLMGKYKDPVILGLPTSDGRGPAALISSSVSVSAVSDLKEGCLDFIRLLISKDVQELCISNPINRTALPAVLDRYMQRFTYEYKAAGFTSEKEAAQYDYYFPTEEMKASYIANMEKVEVVWTSDASIRAIVNEELSALYSGQKDVKEIETMLESRLKILYSEKYSK